MTLHPSTVTIQWCVQTATLMVRPRGLHLPEKHFLVDGKPIPGCLFDFGMFFFHNAHALLSKGSGPYFYLPKLQSHLEARLWNSIFIEAQHLLGVPQGSIKVFPSTSAWSTLHGTMAKVTLSTKSIYATR